MKKTLSIVALLLTGLAISLWHSRSGELHSTKIFIMDTLVELTVKGQETKTDDAVGKAVQELRRINERLGYQNSLIDRLNRERTLKDREAYSLIRLSREIHDASYGAFSITLRPMLDAWGFTGLHPYRLPTPAEFEAWRKSPSDKEIRTLDDAMTIEIPEGMLIDLGGIAKGYAADRACEILKAAGIDTGLVNAGGDITAFGSRTWKVGIKNPGSEGIFAVIPLKDKAVATSGDYERFFVQGSKRYSHILDPANGLPAQGLISATVVAESCVLADAWATALFVKGPEALGPVLDKRGIGWITVDSKGNVKASGALKPYCPKRIPDYSSQ